MLITNKVKIKINNRYVKYYNDRGYNVKGGDVIDVNVLDLPDSSHVNVDIRCSNCNSELSIKYYNYVLNKKNQGIYLCKKCKYIKTESTNIKKYGFKTNLLNKDNINKSKETMLKKYGVEHYSKTEEFKKLVKENFDSSILKDGLIKKYGVDHYSKTEEFKVQLKDTILEKYGVEHYSKTDEFKNKIRQNYIDKYSKDYNLDIIDYDGDILTILCNKKHTYKIHKYLLKNRLFKYDVNLCTICNPINSSSCSQTEIKLKNFIKENYSSTIIENDRSLGKELDIYLPELKLAFEFNGLYWHNELNKPKNYHLEKTELCLDKGIQLIHVWEDDWLFKQDIVKSMILNKLGKSKKIYARKCIVKEVSDNKLVKEFLNDNHIQGFVGSSIKLGLFFENELVSLMVFGKKRKFMNSVSGEGEYELLRFCNKLNYNVLGGASKLFKYFVKMYNPVEVVSYADRSYSNGNLYKQLGFEFIGKTEPNYHYIIDGRRYYRFGFRKDKLVKEGFDKEKTEHQIMSERGYFRIYNSGNLKYIYSNL